MSQARPTATQATAYAESFIISGKMTEAFKAAFPDSKMAPENIRKKASLLHKSVDIQATIQKLQSKPIKSSNEFDISVSKIKKMLAKAALRGLDNKTDAQGNVVPISLSGTSSALAELNRMNGNHAPARVALGGDPNGAPIQSEISDEELARKLAEYGLER